MALFLAQHGSWHQIHVSMHNSNNGHLMIHVVICSSTLLYCIGIPSTIFLKKWLQDSMALLMAQHGTIRPLYTAQHPSGARPDIDAVGPYYSRASEIATAASPASCPAVSKDGELRVARLQAAGRAQASGTE
jgi:hypothetical protein